MLDDSCRALGATRAPESQKPHLAGVLPCPIRGLGAPRAEPEPQPQKAGDEKQDRKEEEKTRVKSCIREGLVESSQAECFQPAS